MHKFFTDVLLCKMFVIRMAQILARRNEMGEAREIAADLRLAGLIRRLVAEAQRDQRG